MTEHPGYSAAVERYELQRVRDADVHLTEPVVPDRPQTIHAYRDSANPFAPPRPRNTPPRGHRQRTEPEFFEGAGGGAPSMCGQSVRVVLPHGFDPNDPLSCEECGRTVRGTTPDPEPGPGFTLSPAAAAALRRRQGSA